MGVTAQRVYTANLQHSQVLVSAILVPAADLIEALLLSSLRHTQSQAPHHHSHIESHMIAVQHVHLK